MCSCASTCVSHHNNTCNACTVLTSVRPQACDDGVVTALQRATKTETKFNTLRRCVCVLQRTWSNFVSELAELAYVQRISKSLKESCCGVEKQYRGSFSERCVLCFFLIFLSAPEYVICLFPSFKGGQKGGAHFGGSCVVCFHNGSAQFDIFVSVVL